MGSRNWRHNLVLVGIEREMLAFRMPIMRWFWLVWQSISSIGTIVYEDTQIRKELVTQEIKDKFGESQ